MKLKRDYEKISYQCFFEYDEALEKDLMDDTPDFDLTQLVEYFINHSYDYKGEEMISGFGSEIERMVGITDEQVEWFCQEYAEYEHWSVVFYNYFHTNPHHYNIEDVWLQAGDTSHDMDLIFVYYQTKCKPRLTLKRGPLQLIANTTNSSSQININNDVNTISLPPELDNEAAQKYFPRIVGKYIDSYNKLIAPQIQLAYICSKIYDCPRPVSALEKFFGIRNFSASLTQATYAASRADVIKWRKEIDDTIFFD